MDEDDDEDGDGDDDDETAVSIIVTNSAFSWLRRISTRIVAVLILSLPFSSRNSSLDVPCCILKF